MHFSAVGQIIQKRISRWFSFSGLTDSYIYNPRINVFGKIQKPDSIYDITSKDYYYLHDILTHSKTKINKEVDSPYIFIKFDSLTYMIGNNKVVKNRNHSYSLSEKDEYNIKRIIHYYDFIDRTDLYYMGEIKIRYTCEL